MIKRLRVSNYRSLGEDVDVELGRLTVLAGRNGAGKSSFLDVLRFVSDAVQLGLPAAITKRGGMETLLRSGSDRLMIWLEISSESLAGTYALEIAGTGRTYVVQQEHGRVSWDDETYEFRMFEGKLSGVDDLRPAIHPQEILLPVFAGDPRFRPLAELLRDVSVYTIFPAALRDPQPVISGPAMDELGANWLSVLADPGFQEWRPELLAGLWRLVGDLVDVETHRVGGYFIARFRHALQVDDADGVWLDAAQESDGTLRVAALLTALLQEPRPAIMGLEEPELYVHPGALPLLCDYVRQATESSQILMTTHSPEFLDQFDVDEIQVVERCRRGTTIAPLAKDQRDFVRDRLLTLGEVMRTEGLRQEVRQHSAVRQFAL